MKKNILLVFVCFSFIFIACKKEEDGLKPGKNDTGPRQLLNNNSGFREVYVNSYSALLTNPSSGLLNLYKPQDISLLPGGQTMAFAFESHLSYSSRTGVYLGMVDIKTGIMTNALHATNYTAPDVSYPEIASFVPHSSTYYYTELMVGNPSTWDIKGQSINERFTGWRGIPRISRTGDYVMNDADIFFWKNKKGRYFHSGFITNNKSRLLGSIFEPLPNSDKGLLVMMRADSLLVALLDTVTNFTSTPIFKAKIQRLEGINDNLDFHHLVRTTFTGTRTGVCFMMPIDGVNHYWTLSYDNANQSVQFIHNNTTLPYSGTGTDYDIDDLGNIYYSGYANNGQNTAGVSIYKHSPSETSLIGSDNFLKQGEIMLLRYEYGKVWLGISLYKDSDNKQVRPQISFCEQL